MTRFQKWFQAFAERNAERIDRYANLRWHSNPFTASPKGDRETYLLLAAEARQKIYPLIDSYEAEIGYKIDYEWLHALALHTQIVIKSSTLCYEHGRLLYSTLRHYISTMKPDALTIIETGTARGFSALCMARALEDAGAVGRIVTFDVLPHATKMYWNCIDDHEGQKTRAELLATYTDLTGRYILFHQGNTRIELPKLYADRVHFAFLDAMHEYADVMLEFSCIRDRQHVGDVIFFDDYTPRLFPGVVQAVDEICITNNYNKRVITLSDTRGYVIAVKN